jgi:selenocysteine lyase/cysteine desulfurase
MEGVHHNILTEILSREAGIAVRSGLFCAHPYAQKLLQLSREELEYHRNTPGAPLPGMVRVSFGMYNNVREIDLLLDLLRKISNNKQHFNNKYKNAILSAHP